VSFVPLRLTDSNGIAFPFHPPTLYIPLAPTHVPAALSVSVHRRSVPNGRAGVGGFRRIEVEEIGIGFAGSVPTAQKDSALAEEDRGLHRRPDSHINVGSAAEFSHVLCRVPSRQASDARSRVEY